MIGKIVICVDFVELVFCKVGFLCVEFVEFVEIIIDEICNVIVCGESVKLLFFVIFQVCDKNECIGCNLKMGEEVLILLCCVMMFKVLNVLKQ